MNFRRNSHRGGVALECHYTRETGGCRPERPRARNSYCRHGLFHCRKVRAHHRSAASRAGEQTVLPRARWVACSCCTDGLLPALSWIDLPSWSWGWAGVDVFFVLSGFLITGILFDTRDARNRFRVFYMRRTLRIFPLYYAVLFLALITTPLMDWMWNPAWVLWSLYLGNYARFIYLHSPLLPLGAIEHLVSRYDGHVDLVFFLGHFWSLCVEEQFYLVWPLVVFLVRRRETLRLICLCSLPVALAARTTCLDIFPKYAAAELLYRVTPLRVDALLLGGLLALCLRGPEGAKLQRLGLPIFGLFCFGFVAFQVVHRFFTASHAIYVPASGDPVLTTVGYTLIDLGAAALILASLSLDNPIAWFLNLRPLRALGKISYGFYVFHDIFHQVYIRAVAAFIGGRVSVPYFNCVVAGVGLLATILLAQLSFRHFETPFLRLKARFEAS